jgi:flagellar biosynthesis/type III secretory pathway M-ring protein FliF/YscJ
LNVCPSDSRVSAQVKVKGDKRPEIESISIAVLVPEGSREVPPSLEGRERFKSELGDSVCKAAGTAPSNVSIRIAPLETINITGVRPSEPVVEAPGWKNYAPLGLMIAMGGGLLFAGLRLTRGLAPATEEVVVAEDSLRAPGESILAAQDEILDRIRDGVRETVSKNPREAAGVARRWLVP